MPLQYLQRHRRNFSNILFQSWCRPRYLYGIPPVNWKKVLHAFRDFRIKRSLRSICRQGTAEHVFDKYLYRPLPRADEIKLHRDISDKALRTSAMKTVCRRLAFSYVGAVPKVVWKAQYVAGRYVGGI